jgi:hypothetical protein
MPNIQVTVCVIALTQGDNANIDPAFQARLAGLFASTGKPYDKSSPDEWRPFNIDSVSEYLKNASIQASFLSLQLDNKATRNRALRDTRLYIIDPFVLVHAVKGAPLSAEIQAAIFAGPKAFCIVLPAAIPDPLRKDIEAYCQRELSDLWGSWEDQDDAEVVLTHEHFKKYLGRLVRLLTAKPNQEALELARQAFAVMGVGSPPLPQPPSLVRS